MEIIGWLFLALFVVAAVSIVGPGIVGAPWLPTPANGLAAVLKEAGLKPGEVFIDLGCGDGRVLIAAAGIFGAQCIGVEIDPLKIPLARWRVKRAGLSEKVKIIRASAMDAPLAEADVVFLYLSHQLIDRLKPKFARELKPGARIVSFGFMVSGFPLVKTDAGKKWFVYKMALGRNINRYS